MVSLGAGADQFVFALGSIQAIVAVRSSGRPFLMNRTTDQPSLSGPPFARESGVVTSPHVVAGIQRNPIHWRLARAAGAGGLYSVRPTERFSPDRGTERDIHPPPTPTGTSQAK